MRDIFYININTGEVIFTQREAVEQYRQGDRIAVMEILHETNTQVQRTTWEH